MFLILREYRRVYGGLNRNARLMLLYYALTALGNGISGVLLNLYLLKAGLDEAFLGTLTSVQYTVMALAVVPMGLAADRVRKHLQVKTGFWILNAGMTGILLTTEPKALIVAYCLQGIGWAIAAASEYPYLSENTQASERTHVFSMVAVLYAIMPSIGTLTGGYLPAIAGGILGLQGGSLAAFRGALSIAVLASWLAGFGVLRLTASPGDKAGQRGSEVPSRADAMANAGLGSKSGRLKSDEPAVQATPKKLSLKVSRPAVVFGLAMNAGFVGLGAAMFVPYMNVFFSSKFLLETHVIGWIMTAQNILLALGTLVVPRLSERRGPAVTMVLLQGLSVPMLLVMGFSTRLPLFVAAFILRGCLMNMAVPLLDTFSMGAVRSEERGVVNATLNLARNATWAIGGKVGGNLLRDKMFASPMLLASGCYTVGILALFYMRNWKLTGVGQVESENGETR